MGQKHWAVVCALVIAFALASTLTAQQANNPFSDAGAPAATTSETSRSALGIEATPSPGDAGAEPACNANEAERRIEAVLAECLREPWDFVEQPLRDVMTIVSETYDIPIQFDVAAFDAIGASPDIEVSININSVSLRTAFDLMLRNAGAEELDYVIDNEVLLITTHEEVEARLEVKVYRVDDLIGNGVTASPYAADADTLIDLIVASVEHESWQENGTGEGEIKPFPPGMIVISQTHRVQEQVQALLDDLRRNKAAVEAASAQGGAQAAVRPVSRSIRIDAYSVSAKDAPEKIRDALITSVDWNLAGGEIADDERLLTVLKDRVLVRHLPQVVAQVERSVKDFDLSPRRSGGIGGGRGGRGDSHGGGMF